MNKRTMNKRAKKKTKWEEINDFVEEVYAKVDAEIKSRGGNLQEIETGAGQRAGTRNCIAPRRQRRRIRE